MSERYFDDRPVLVLGGGPAGMRTALDLAEHGNVVHLVEREDRLGGRLREIHLLFPTMEPAEELADRLAARVHADQRIVTHLGAELGSLEAEEDGFRVRLISHQEERDDCGSCGSDGLPSELSVGAMVLATGLETVDPGIVPEFGHRLPGVITSLELERLMEEGLQGEVRSVTFVQCVGSRSRKRGVPYCSAVCCAGAIKNALLIKERYPDVEVRVLYIDVRTHGKGWEEMYRRAKEAGVRFIRGQPSMVTSSSGRLMVSGENTLLKELYELESDLVVLQVGLRMEEGTRKLLERLEVSIREDGLPGEHGHFKDSLSTESPGVFLAGSLVSPSDVRGCLEQGSACASRVNIYLHSRH
ncbi:MAG: FAD-dependent oxidoreductase [Methanomassiliicoccales archaeon]